MYWAVVVGTLPAEQGVIDLPLKKITNKAGWKVLTAPDGQPAVTEYRTLGVAEGLTWLELRPKSGRTHQIRVHCAALGCPVLGDPLYQRAEDVLRDADTAMYEAKRHGKARYVIFDEPSASLTAAEISKRCAISERRARLLPAGLAILEALLQHTEVTDVSVDRGGIREGVIIAEVRGGATWRHELGSLVASHRSA